MYEITRLMRGDSITVIKDEFYNFLSNHGIQDLSNTDAAKLRRLMFDYFSSDIFLTQYKKLASLAAEALGYSKNGFIVQKVPTPRIFRPGAHGTSYHCDFWYGHGEKSHTIWVPLSAIDINNTFFICKSVNNDYMYNKLISGKQFLNIDETDKQYFYPVLPDPDQAVLFSSKVIHGSPINRSPNQRLSFDFRIGLHDDHTSTKNINSYFEVVQGEFTSKDIFNGLIFLRYVCGGQNKDTFAQHLLIDNFARVLNLNIVAQEAEVERLGHPMLQEILRSKKLDKNYNAIIIASEAILSQDIQSVLQESSIKVFAALENRFL